MNRELALNPAFSRQMTCSKNFSPVTYLTQRLTIFVLRWLVGDEISQLR